MNKLSLVVPVFNEEEVILQFLKETRVELKKLKITHEYVFVDDGSRDGTVAILRQEAKKDPRVKLVALSYNHGKAYAFSAAIEHASGDYLLYMDPDLQDPPKEIPRFYHEAQKGYDLVWGVRRTKEDSWWNRQWSRLFWKSLNGLTGLQIPKGIAVMRIFNKEFAREMCKYREANRFIEGIFSAISKKWTVLEVDQRPRFAGVTKFNFRKKINLALDAIFDFSEVPLKITVHLGMVLTGLGFFALVLLVSLKIFLIHFQAGWPSIIASLIMMFGIQIFFLGIMSIYIGKIYKEVKGRPLYSVKEKINLS